MSIHIPLDHSIFTLKNKVQEASQGFLNAHGFNYFQYLRCYSNGAVNCLTNDTGLIEQIQQVDNEPVIFSSFEGEKSPDYWFLWDEKLPTTPVEIARGKFNFHHGITWVRRSKHYYDMIAVALPHEQANLASFYANKIRAIEQFVKQFDNNNQDLIQIMDDTAILLPTPYRDVNYDKLCLKNGKIHCTGKYGSTYLTAQEFACLKLYLQGDSYKQIAKSLQISDRTVETYFHRLRERTGYISQTDLTQMLLLANICT